YLNAFKYVKFSDLNQTLEDFSEYSCKTSQKTLVIHFMLKDVPRSLHEVFQSFMLKISQKTLGRLSKILGRLLANFLRSLLMYFMLEDFPRSLREVFQSLFAKVVQRNDVKWRPSLSMLRNDI
ncbi:hypothetical protein IGI04_015215, partial [Brassica rapa subsp. trilocularis]